MAHISDPVNDTISLVRDAQSGRMTAFEELMRHYEKFVFKVAFAQLKNFHDAEDTTQVVFIESFLHLKNLNDPSKFSAWLRRLALFRCTDHLRGETSATNDSNELTYAAAAPMDVEAETDNHRESIELAIKGLSNTLRETMELHYLHDFPLREISARLGVPLNTVKWRLHDARRRLREKGATGMREIHSSIKPP